jgi:hypothetical protein
MKNIVGERLLFMKYVFIFHPSGHPEDVHQDLLEQITTALAGLHGR